MGSYILEQLEQEESEAHIFPDQALYEAQRIINRREKILENRPEVHGITIDPYNAEDLDDAIWIERKAHGGYVVQVSVPDLSMVIHPETSIFWEAYRRQRTRYDKRPTRTMLPDSVSKEVFSIFAGRWTPTITIEIELAENGDMRKTNIKRTKIKPVASLSYEQADMYLKNEDLTKSNNNIRPCLKTLSHVTKMLYEKRKATVSPEIYSLLQEHPEIGEESNGNGIFKYDAENPLDSNGIVQECMILANHVLAQTLHIKGLQGIFRNHILQIFSLKLNKFDKELEMKLIKAFYSRKRYYHESLGLRDYTHGTSPLRRFMDIAVHLCLLSPEKMTSEILDCILEAHEIDVEKIQIDLINDQKSFSQLLEKNVLKSYLLDSEKKLILSNFHNSNVAYEDIYQVLTANPTYNQGYWKRIKNLAKQILEQNKFLGAKLMNLGVQKGLIDSYDFILIPNKQSPTGVRLKTTQSGITFTSKIFAARNLSQAKIEALVHFWFTLET